MTKEAIVTEEPSVEDFYEPLSEDEESVPAEEPQQSFTWPQLFGQNYRLIVNELLVGTPQSGGNTYNKHDAQVLRVKAVEVAERLTYRMFGKDVAEA